METQWHSLTTAAGEPTSRRRVMQGLGALGIMALGVVGIRPRAAAATQQRCKRSCPCRKHESKKQCLRRCKKTCP
jgi:hypothetical protein